MTIVHLTTYLQGGAGRIITNLALHQRSRGSRVVIVTSRSPRAEYGHHPHLLETLDANGVEVEFVESLFTRSSDLLVQALDRLAADLDVAAVDVLHAHAAFPALLGLLVRGAGGGRAAILQTMHGWGIQKTAEQALMDVRIMNRIDQVVAVSAASGQRLVTLGVDETRLITIPNGIEPLGTDVAPEAEHERQIRHWRQDGRTVICCVGSVSARKNQILLVRAIARMPSPWQVGLVCVGDGDPTEIRAEADRLGVGGSLYLTGHAADVTGYYRLADWCTLPSRDEGLPLSLLEAFRAGLPVLASNIAAIADLVTQDETGLLFQNDDVEDCARAICRAVAFNADERSRLGKRAWQIWNAEYRQETMFSRYAALYSRLTAVR